MGSSTSPLYNWYIHGGSLLSMLHEGTRAKTGWLRIKIMCPSGDVHCCFSEISPLTTDLMFVRFFYSGFYRYDSFFVVYSILPIADFRFFVGLANAHL
jgi:hypothetical protein